TLSTVRLDEKRPGRGGASCGSTVRQRSVASGQRGAKRQPTGGSHRLGGLPGRPARARSSPIVGSELVSISVYGCSGSLNMSAVVAYSTALPAYMIIILSVSW